MDVTEWAEYARSHKYEFYEPYPYQLQFHHCPEGEFRRPFGSTGEVAQVRAVVAGNKVGKTMCAAYEVAYHLTGNYPGWWDGIRFDYAVEWLVAGVTNDKTRDICQKELFGEPTDPKSHGTVPKELTGKVVRKPGVPNAYDSVLVKHRTGKWSKVMFQAYKQDKASFMGIPIDGGWMDEEPPGDVFNQFVRGTIAKDKSTLLLTFTPESGATDLVFEWLNDLKPGRGLVCAGWRDAPHIWDVPGKVDSLRSLFPKWEWDMREEGKPVMGTGRIFSVAEEDIACDPIEIPKHWPRICGIDFGMEHPFAAAWVAHDPENDIIYVTDIFKKPDLTIAECASVLKRHGDIPVAWPHDMAKRDPKSGKMIQQLFAAEGVSMLKNHFTNPPQKNQKEGSGGNSVTAGLMAMTERMSLGSFRVFRHLPEWFEEFRNYHTENGVIVKKRDDLMDATRYAALSIRHAVCINKPKKVVKVKNFYAGEGGWMR